MKATTKELLNQITKSEDISTFLEDHSTDFFTENVTDYLSRLIKDKGLRLSNIVRHAQQGDYTYKVVKGERKASRDILICIALGMHLSFPETQLLLRIAKFAQLDPRNKRDSVIIYGINKNIDVVKINEILFDLNMLTF